MIQLDRCCESPQFRAKARYLKISAARRRKSCSCWLLSELIPLSMIVSRGSTKPNTRGLPACRATNTSMRSSTYNKTKEGHGFNVGGGYIFSLLTITWLWQSIFPNCLHVPHRLRIMYLDLKVSDQCPLFLYFCLLILLGLSLFLLLWEKRWQALIQLHHGFIIQIFITTAVLLCGLNIQANRRHSYNPKFLNTMLLCFSAVETVVTWSPLSLSKTSLLKKNCND